MSSAMLDKERFRSFVGEVVEYAAPDQKESYDFESRELVDELFANRDIRKQTQAGRADLRSWEEGMKFVLQMVPILWATYKTLKEIVDTHKSSPIPEGEVASRWAKAL